MRLIYLSPLPWASFAQRPHKFVQWFHRRTGGSVAWIDPYPSRFPRLSDLRRAARPADGRLPTQPAWLRVLRPRTLPIEPLRHARIVNRALWRTLVSQLASAAAGGNTLIVVGKPSALALDVLEQVVHKRSLYDMMDDFPAFHRGLAARAMARTEARLVGTVDELWASSTALAQAWTSAPHGVRLVPNALDAHLLGDMARRTGTGAARKVFGYLGTLGSWFDWDWLAALAAQRPHDAIRLIGPMFTERPAVLPPNVELHPPLPHDAALAAMREFDVGLIPFCIQRLTDSVDPIKYYEYRALGLPVLSTNFGEMRQRRSEAGTFISDGLEDIGRHAAAALHYAPQAEDVDSFRAANSWDARFDATRLLDHLTT